MRVSGRTGRAPSRARMLVAAAVGAVIAAIAAGGAYAAGETIVVATPGGFESVDPAVGSDFSIVQQVEWITCVQLVNYADPAGLAVQPEAAASMPTVSADGKTYTFTIRPGLGFSPPSTETVSAASFERAIERVQAFGSGGASLVSDIASMDAAGNTLTITLAAPDPGLLVRLAMPYFCAVPSDAPMDAPSATPLATAGPYYIYSKTANEVDIRRNPNYGGDRVRNLGRILFQLGGSNPDNIAAAQSGTVDYVPQLGVMPSLAASYGPGSPAAAEGHQQYFEYPSLGIQTLVLNASAGRAFADANLRKAVNYGVNRNTIAGVYSFTPHDQYLPTGIPGFTEQSFYPMSGNAALAASYASDAGVTPSSPRSVTLCARTGLSATVAGNVDSELEPLGIDVTVQTYSSPGTFFADVANPSGPCDLSDVGLSLQLADAVHWLRTQFRSGQGVAPAVRYTSAALDQQFDDALPLAGAARDAAAADIDEALSDAAVLVPYANRIHGEFFSARIGCQSNQPLYGVNLNRLCVRVADSDGSVSTGGDATPDAPLQTSVTSPSGGDVTVQQAVTTEAPPNYAFGDLLEQQLFIEAPDAPDAAHPLVLTFELDGALLGSRGLTYQTVVVLRNGVPIDGCTTAGTLGPDPCVNDRHADAEGDAVLTVLTSHASTWNFAASRPLASPARPVTAGVALSVKFGLGGNFGLGIFAAGYPKSVEIDCDTLEPTGAETAASGKLVYDASTGLYVYTWKTAKSYANSCRRLELRFDAFPGRTLNVTFRK
jgi:peptide/nickel transport system substrate-binding protein